MNKLPQITFAFWVMKICATTLGETAADHVSHDMGFGYAQSSMILISIFLVTLIGQLLAKKYHPVLFWMVILSTSLAGTAMSDYMDRTLKLGYQNGSLILLGCLILTFAFWRYLEGSLSVSQIKSRRGEILYWVAILFSNTLGTALGDFLSDNSGLGFAGSALLIGGLIAVLAILSLTTNISRVLLFWLAFVLTRPFGAELGDFLTKKKAEGGLDLGTLASSGILAALLGIFIIWTTVRIKLESESRSDGASA